MSIKDKLQIILITYNRKNKLKYTLDAILAPDSPIKDFDITILDNASTDGTSELIDEYCTKFNNLKHIRHNRNIGGNANICRAFEMAEKEYIWVLCDDDKYDFSNWSEVEEKIIDGTDIICVADYVFSDEKKNNKAYQIFQLTFVPAGIYKTSNITDSVLINMYDSIFTMFQQSCLSINIINNSKKIHVLSKPIVFNGLHFEDKVEDISYTRGSKDIVLQRRKDTVWILGFVNILTLLKDENLRKECVEVAIPYKDIYGDWDNFYNCLYGLYINKNNLNYFYEIYNSLLPKRQLELKNRYALCFKHIFKTQGLILRNREKFIYFIKSLFYKNTWKNIFQSIFSIRNSNDKKHKILTILGIKMNFKKKRKGKKCRLNLSDKKLKM